MNSRNEPSHNDPINSCDLTEEVLLLPTCDGVYCVVTDQDGAPRYAYVRDTSVRYTMPRMRLTVKQAS